MDILNSTQNLLYLIIRHSPPCKFKMWSWRESFTASQVCRRRASSIFSDRFQGRITRTQSSSKKQGSLINRLLESNKWKKQNKQKQVLKFSHIHPLVPELAPGLGPSLECSRVVEMLERRMGKQFYYSIFNVSNDTCIITIVCNVRVYISCTHTLSKREIFMAFIVAESTNMGGPSSNTSLMNSFPFVKRSNKKRKEKLFINHLYRTIQSFYVLFTKRCGLKLILLSRFLLWSVVPHQRWPTSSQLLAMVFFSHLHCATLSQISVQVLLLLSVVFLRQAVLQTFIVI